MAVPHIISESRVNVFKFYENAEIHEAILAHNQIMRLAKVFPADQKQAAIAFAFQLCQKYATLITPNSTRYRVWVDVRCPHEIYADNPLLLMS